MEKKLKKLFDYQRFAGNAALQAVIDGEHRPPRELSLDEADLVSAAGSAYLDPNEERKRLHP